MAAAYQPLSERLRSLLECSICMEVKEIRVLPCEHKICVSCLSDICFKRHESAQPACPFCNCHLNRKPDQYLVCRAMRYFQKHQEKIEQLLEKTTDRKCEQTECKCEATRMCKVCKASFCPECQTGKCRLKDTPHDLAAPVRRVASGKVQYAEWEKEKVVLIHSLSEKKSEMIAKVKQLAQKLADGSDEELGEAVERMLPAFQHADTELSRLSDQLCQEKATFNFLQTLTEGATDAKMKVINDQLELFEQTRKVELKEYESLFEDFLCNDVVWSPAGHLLTAGEKGLKVFHIEPTGSATVVKSLLENKKVFTLQVHHDEVVAGVTVKEFTGPTEIVVFNREYEEVRRWSADTLACDFAVVDDQIIFSSIKDQGLKVFSMYGDTHSDVPWNGVITGIAATPPGSVVFTDHKYHRVYKRKVFGSKRGTVWAVDVTNPFSLCEDSEGFIWISAGKDAIDSIIILSAQGRKVQEIKDQKLALHTNWAGTMVHGGYLYVTHAGGVGRLKLAYADVDF